jgi:iron complex outermembrane receptor protein
MSKFTTQSSRGAFRAALFSVSSLAAVCAWSPVAAQDATDDEARDDNVIIVTAQLREQNVQDIPLSITAVSGEMLEARGQDRIDDVAFQAPSVQLQKSPAGNSMAAYIRGVGQGDASPSVEPGVGIYIDDVYFGSLTASAFDLVDLDRVEVLRGPQGTLAGMNSMGGAIKIYSRRPEGDGGYVEATIGNLNRRDLKATADFTIIPDAVFARITGVTRHREGHVTRYDYACVNPNDPYVQPGTSVVTPGQAAIPRLAPAGDCVLGKNGGQDMYGLRGALRIAPVGSPLEINIIGDYSDDNSASPANTLIVSAELTGRQNVSVPYQGVPFDNRFVTYGDFRRSNAVLNDFYASYANYYDPGVTYRAANAVGPGGLAGAPNGPFMAPTKSGAESWGVSGQIDYKLSDNLALKSITGYRSYKSISGQDNDQSPVVFIQNADFYTGTSFSEELRLAGSFMDDTLNVIIGGIYYEAKNRPLSRIHTPFSGFGPAAKPTFSFLNDDTADSKVLAGFGNISWEPIEGLTLEGGIRVTDEKKDYLFGRLNPDGQSDYLPLSNPLNPLTGFVGSYSATVTDYRAAISYNWTPDIMTYATFATGHKGGGISPRPYSYFQIRPFGPEKLRSFEAGFKVDLLDRRVRVNADAFYMKYIGYQGTPQVCLGLDDQPLPVNQGGVPGLCGQYLNIGDAKVKGFEVETFLEPVDNWTIDGSLSLTDFKFTKINYPTTSIVVGAKRPGIGDWKWSVGSQYKFDLGGAGSLTPRVDVTYTPGYCGSFLCEVNGEVDNHTLVNARLTYRTEDDDWSVSLEAQNLMDKKYYVNKFYNVWYTSAQPGLPQQIALTVRRSF